ncbi:MAG: ATP-dependent DNA helicase PcrA [Elusimicrobia bacterium ADurb.Bin231]|nr:MAG: ATP-dependent DNA helicase PcrA [Elusimicrobia bacterium ADurb.Bin231]
MVLAGPGSGKTRVLTERVAYMVNEKNISQTNILCLTFSNKAAKEMRDRLEDKIPYCKVFISTFHGLGLSILEKYFEKVGRTRNFNLIDEVESREIIAELIKNKKAVTTALRAIRNFKQGLIWQYSSREHEQIFNEYNAKIQYENAFDLDDLIYLPAMLFGNAPEILDEYREKYKWILIDEYQDINARQYELITLLAGKINANIFVIGDPNQSIYGFRGSDIKFIELFKKEYPATGVIRLKNSFRCLII